MIQVQVQGAVPEKNKKFGVNRQNVLRKNVI